jgi:5-methylcytosine-specific restriction endonuclease McrA
MPILVCLFCGKEKKYFPSQSKGKYCSNKCQQNYELHNIYIPAALKGELGWKSMPVLRRVITELKGYRCSNEVCGLLDVWHGHKLVLQLDHIDGNPDNNDIDNLRFLCPNCHSQTPTYKGGNIKNRKKDTRSKEKRKRNKTVA